MSYVPTEWATGDVVTAEKLNKIEDELVALDSESGSTHSIVLRVTEIIAGNVDTTNHLAQFRLKFADANGVAIPIDAIEQKFNDGTINDITIIIPKITRANNEFAIEDEVLYCDKLCSRSTELETIIYRSICFPIIGFLSSSLQTGIAELSYANYLSDDLEAYGSYKYIPSN